MARNGMLLLELHSHKSAFSIAETSALIDWRSTCRPRAVPANNFSAPFACLVGLPAAGAFSVLLRWLGEQVF